MIGDEALPAGDQVPAIAVASGPEPRKAHIATTLLGSRRSVAGVAALYGTSVALLGLSDAIAAHVFHASDFGEYQFVRQLGPVLVVLVLLGIDQVLVRDYPGPRSHEFRWDLLLPRLVCIAGVIGLMAAIACVVGFHISYLAGATLAVAIPAQTSSEWTAAYMRARGKYASGAAVQQGYRLVLGGLVLLSVPLAAAFGDLLPFTYAISTVTLGVVAVIVLRRELRGVVAPRIDRATFRTLRQIGIRLAIITVCLGGLDWVDQAALAAKFDSMAEIGRYTALKVYLVLPFVSLVSILGFAALPEVSKRADVLELRAVLELLAIGIGAAVMLGSLLIIFFMAGGRAILPYQPTTAVLHILVGAGMARFIYLVPSVVLGVTATKQTLTWFAVSSIAVLIVEGTVVLFLPARDPVLAASVAYLVACWLRLTTAVGFCFWSIRSLQRRRSL